MLKCKLIWAYGNRLKGNGTVITYVQKALQQVPAKGQHCEL